VNGGIEGEHEPARHGSEENVQRNGRFRANSTFASLSAVNVELARKWAFRSTLSSVRAAKGHTAPKSRLACDVLLDPTPSMPAVHDGARRIQR
jgi:hypothetical protein